MLTCGDDERQGQNRSGAELFLQPHPDDDSDVGAAEVVGSIPAEVGVTRTRSYECRPE